MAHFSMPGVRPVPGCLLLLCFSLVSFCLAAQPMRVKDINPGVAGSDPAWLENANGTLYFGARSGASFGLYKSNGTESGTVKLRDFPVAPTHITYVNGVVYFSASDGVHGRELWKSNGTAAGTVMVKDLNPGPDSTRFISVAGVGNTVYFSDESLKLWKSNGTDAGTVVVADNLPCYALTAYNGALYFLAGGRSAQEGRSLGRSDGTAAGTTIVKQFITGNESFVQGVYFLENVNDTLYLLVGGEDRPATYTLWRSNGTEAGTTPHGIVWSASRRSTFLSYRFIGNVLYFSGTDVAVDTGDLERGLYRYDLATATAQLLLNAWGTPFSYAGLTDVNGTLYFVRADQSNRTRTLLRLNGDSASVIPGFTGTNPSNLTGVNGTLFFAAADETAGNELWKYNPAAAAAVPIFRFNVGGGAYTNTLGIPFAEEAYVTGGRLSTPATGDVANTDDDPLYRRGRTGDRFGYRIPTGNGVFLVTLHFNETWWGNLVPGDKDSRRFNVLFDESNFYSVNIWQKAGGPMRAHQTTYEVNVTDGVLNIDFLKAAADLPLVSAIEVMPANSVFRINVGGDGYSPPDGRFFLPDQNYVSPGRDTRYAAGEVANTDDDELYRSGRYGAELSYSFPVNTGEFGPSYDVAYYRVVLHFNETYWGNLAPGGVGSRRFNVDIEGERKLTEYDIFAKAGGAMRAVREVFTVAVRDKMLDLRFTKGSRDFARVCAIEVYPVAEPGVDTGSRVAAGPEASEMGPLRISPNPATSHIRVTTPGPAAGITATRVVDLSGREFLRNRHRVAGEHQLEIDVATLGRGVYLLQLQTAGGPHTVRFLKQ